MSSTTAEARDISCYARPIVQMAYVVANRLRQQVPCDNEGDLRLDIEIPGLNGPGIRSDDALVDVLAVFAALEPLKDLLLEHANGNGPWTGLDAAMKTLENAAAEEIAKMACAGIKPSLAGIKTGW